MSDRAVARTADQVAVSDLPLSNSAPHLFGDRLDTFQAKLRRLLTDASPDGNFNDWMRPIGRDLRR